MPKKKKIQVSQASAGGTKLKKKMVYLPPEWPDKTLGRLAGDHDSFSAYVRALISEDARGRRIRLPKGEVRKPGTH